MWREAINKKFETETDWVKKINRNKKSVEILNFLQLMSQPFSFTRVLLRVVDWWS
jgi:hypothetical protein